MDHGELVQHDVGQDHKQEHVCVLLVTHVELLVKELLLRQDRAELLSLMANGLHTEHGVHVL